MDRAAYLVFGLSALVVIVPNGASALCFAPHAPIAPWGRAPTAPSCGTFGDLSGCEEWQIKNFRQEVEDWLQQLQQYAYDAQDYANDAIEYANCESDQAVEEWNSFVGQ